MAHYTKQKDGRYRTKISYLDASGSTRVMYLSAKTIKELEAKVKEKKVNPQPAAISFKGYAQKWLETFKQNTSMRTQDMYIRSIRSLVNGLSDISIDKISRIDIQSQINANKEHPRSCEQMLLTAKQIFDNAIADGLITKSPCNGITLPRHIKQTRRALTSEERQAIRSADLDIRQRAFVALLLGTGMRPAEAYALTWHDIKFVTEEIVVCKSLTFCASGKPEVVHPKTNTSIRTIQAPEWLFKVLNDYKAINPTLLLFGGEYGQYKYKTNYSDEWNRIKKKIVEALGHDTEITPYYFRHNYCTELYYSGISIKEAQRLMGHSSHEMIMRVYSHLDSTLENTKSKLNTIDF